MTDTTTIPTTPKAVRRRVHSPTTSIPIAASASVAIVPHEQAGGSDGEGAILSYASHQARAPSPLLSSVVDLYRVRKSLVQAEGDMTRRIKSKARSAASYRLKVNGIVTPEGKMPDATDEDLAVVRRVYPSFYAALDTISAQKSVEEKALVKLVRSLPIMAWAQEVRGLAPVSVGTLIGEAGGSPMIFNTPSKLWKRYGLAVIDGKSQRKATDPEMAARQGFNPSRRAALYVIGENMIRARNAQARIIYDAAKAAELAKIEAEPNLKMTKGWAHKRALRKVQKQLVLAFWLVWRDLDKGITDPAQWNPKARSWMGSEPAPKALTKADLGDGDSSEPVPLIEEAEVLSAE